VRQVVDSRVGTQVGVDLGNVTGWTATTTGTVSWTGQTASLSANSSLTLATTDAINMGADMVTAVADVTLSGFVTVTVLGITNTTEAGAVFGGAGAAAYTYSQVLPAGLGAVSARTLAGEVFRRIESGHDWIRVYFTFETGATARTVQFHPGGGVWRKTPGGDTVNVSSRFATLADEVESLCVAGGVRLSASFNGQRPVIEVSPPADKSASVRFSTDYGNVVRWRAVRGAPRATRVVVAGAGEGASREIRERSSGASETEWGRRVEVFRDARDVEAGQTATLDQRGDEVLADASRTSGFAVDVIDVPGVSFGADYVVGDKVSVNIEGSIQDDFIAEVEVRADKSGTSVKPVVASAQLADSEPELYARVSNIVSRMDGLERRR